jgi:hypothetical protein
MLFLSHRRSNLWIRFFFHCVYLSNWHVDGFESLPLIWFCFQWRNMFSSNLYTPDKHEFLTEPFSISVHMNTLLNFSPSPFYMSFLIWILESLVLLYFTHLRSAIGVVSTQYIHFTSKLELVIWSILTYLIAVELCHLPTLFYMSNWKGHTWEDPVNNQHNILIKIVSSLKI